MEVRDFIWVIPLVVLAASLIAAFVVCRKIAPAFAKTRLGIDIENYNLQNTSEEVALAAHYFSRYKGCLVIRFKIPTKRSFSLGALFIDRRDNTVATMKHEYGHTVQLKELGLLRYLVFIAIPSVFSQSSGMKYYEQMWEVTADIFGEVDPATRKHQSHIIQEGFSYLESSKTNKIRKGFFGKTPKNQ